MTRVQPWAVSSYRLVIGEDLGRCFSSLPAGRAGSGATCSEVKWYADIVTLRGSGLLRGVLLAIAGRAFITNPWTQPREAFRRRRRRAVRAEVTNTFHFGTKV